MLEKVVSIKNFGRFKNSAAIGDVTFRHAIFAENAPDIITGRVTLGSVQPPEVQLLAASGPIKFRCAAWSVTYPKIFVFDSTYVRPSRAIVSIALP